LPAIFSGSVIVEALFDLHGIGQLGIEAVLHRDYPVLLGLSSVTATLTLLGVRLADVLYAAFDPRLRRA
jgi:peptide/nickel transport system permease protein